MVTGYEQPQRRRSRVTSLRSALCGASRPSQHFGALWTGATTPMRFSRRNVLRAAAGATALLAAGRSASAQTYPDRPIRLIVPFPPGGAYDTLGRPWADRIKLHLGTVVIENIGGGGASLGAAGAAPARPGGDPPPLRGTPPPVNKARLQSKTPHQPPTEIS